MSTYERIRELAEGNMRPADIARELEVSRQYVGQVLARERPPGDAHVKHGTFSLAARCDCERCTATKTRIARVLPDIIARLHRGQTLSQIDTETGQNVHTMVTSARRDTEAGRPTVLTPLLAAFDATADLRGRGRPRRAA